MLSKKLITLLVFSGIVSSSAFAEEAYWKDPWGQYIRTIYGECVRTINWTPESALPECEGHMQTATKVMDADNDGIPDDADQCPGTASGIAVDSKGCAKDSDGDGVVDSKDKCPGTTTGVRVNAQGCELDSDNDGIVDSMDKCPGTSAGIAVGKNGCARDTDGDGIIDANDDCPNTAAGIAVNTRGCELKADIRLDDVKFNTGTAELDGDSRNLLTNIATVLKSNPHLKFEIAGHTDNTGDYNFNVQLSEKRANSVRQYLVDQGVAADRLSAQGYGPDKPIASNATREGRQQNRRVELVLQ